MRRHAINMIFVFFAAVVFGLMVGCSGGGGASSGGPVATDTVSGIAAAGAVISGTVYLKDSAATPNELSKTIAADGSYSFDVTGKSKPFMLKAVGNANGNNYTLYSFAEGTGTANINPMSNLVVTHASGGSDLTALYNSASQAVLQSIATNFPTALRAIQDKLQPLLQTFNISTVNPIADPYNVNHQGLDGMLDDVRIDISNGTVTITNRTTNAEIFTAPANAILGGTVTTGNIPQPTTSPTAPSGANASADNGHVLISWNEVSGATSYNVYWSTTSGVTKTSGTKITGTTTPYTHANLTNGTTYYYIVTAVNSSGESVASAQTSATPAAGWIPTELNATLGRSLYATDTEIFAATYSGIYSTIDNGMPWFSKGPKDKDVSDVITSHQYILAATLDGVYRSSDNGKSWLLTNGSPGVSAGGGIYGPHVFAKDSSYVFIIAWARGIFRSGDDGAHWEQMFLGQAGFGYQDYAASATFIYTVGEKIFINGSGPTGSVMYSSSDNGNTWIAFKYPSAYDLQSLYYDNGNLFACDIMGVYLSKDLGISWSTQYSNTIGQHGELIGLGSFRNIISYNHTLIAAVDFMGIYISRDNGISWTSFNDGLISDWEFIGLAVKPPYIWALRDSGNVYRRPLTDI